ncbi:sulfate ABC transporter substrate-binding protein [Vibrio cincinnatiensis]|jgi:sulfate transport system substrate-binding protein|uniref:Sulfate-binding protein n=1 Tax=Vibrio cincinnatiensis DSM 19608 TaxID=1123491 RepID=A0A1T4NCI7_VIBCI|nr:sulfate ABC transporter substrate-binding protein [Vibrio cincinnatiensis]MCG3723430.1 sulfate ABC transporter substrate-binding protein [Vibrio cincinnatiensis]MCG3737472.1 sulfate ABC transporter substrate-binding protein [Vibrio cincinnatiensis]SJZ77012.1 sulfate transport system substrate-binding protein [Vibrio cincinnatiensis DSM 19608]SUP49114.1 periplasmic sulfate binding protein SBP [Vibrio cincinnatiensis]
MRKWLLTLSLFIFAGNAAAKDIVLLNVSYDPTRELYQQYNASFTQYWKEKTGQTVTVRQSHGGSGRQAVSVMNGIEADVVTLALAYDIDAIANVGRVDPSWLNRLPHNSAPYTSTIVFLVRKGNPKNIHDWDDLVKAGIDIITPNPRTSGGARWNYLAAWGYALSQNQDDESQAQQFVKALFDNVKVLDTGARAASNTFIERKMGDVLIAWENEALLITNQLKNEQVEIIVPSRSILAEPTVAIVDRVVDRKNTRAVAQAYLEYLYSSQGQDIAARHFYRPRAVAIAEQYSDLFPKLELFTIDERFGGWEKAHKIHFAQGGIFDQITRR